MSASFLANASVNHLTHMMYLPSRDHWIEVSPLPDLYGLGEMLEFKNGQDAALWLMEPDPAARLDGAEDQPGNKANR